MKKQSALAFPLLSLLLFFVCALPVVLVLPFACYMGPTLVVMLTGPPEHMLAPEPYARRLVANVSDVEEEHVELRHVHQLQAPEKIWAVLARYEDNGTQQTKLMCFKERPPETTIQTCATYYTVSREAGSLRGTLVRYGDGPDRRWFVVHGELPPAAVAESDPELFISVGESLEARAHVVGDSFLLLAPWPEREAGDAAVRVTARDESGAVVGELVIPWLD